MNRLIKTIILIVSIGIITFAVLKIVSPNIFSYIDFLDNSSEKLTEIAQWSSEETDNKCKLSLTVYNNNYINVDVEFQNFSTNGNYMLNEFYNCQYDSEMIYWEFNYGKNYDSYASIVPNDCERVQIDGVMFESKKGEVQINNETISFKYVIIDVARLEEHKIVLFDEKGKPHKEKEIINSFY